MPLLAWIILFTLLGGVLSVVAAAVYLLLPEGLRQRLMPHTVSFAIGALLGAAFLALLPHALEGQADHFHDISFAVLLGLLGFFLLEKLVLWRHCHTDHCEVHPAEDSHNHGSAAGTLVLIGDATHNLVDGILIAAAFLHDTHLGIVTALAVAAHEIPQEVGNFAILLHTGYSRKRALTFNLLASLTTIVGGVLAYYALGHMLGALPYVLAVAAASFIYIAVADLIPGLHRRAEPHETAKQMLLIAAGVGVIWATHATMHGAAV